MKAIILEKPEGSAQLKQIDLNTPVISKGEVLVKVKAIGINPVDVKTTLGKGLYGKLKDLDPLIVGWDISGVVTQTGEDVSSFSVGDEVFGMVNFPGHGQAYAEYVAAPASHLAKKPSNISFEEAAAATLAALTAWQDIVHQAKVKAGQKVLVHAASGGVGHFAVQIARHLGAYVIGTSSAANKEFVLSLGADEHIDYKSQNFEEVVSEADLVIEIVGGENIARSLKVVKKGGVLLSNLGISDEIAKTAKEEGITAIPYLVHSSGEDMQQLAGLLEKGILKAHVSETFPFDKLAEAHRQVEGGHTVGKVVVSI